MGDAYSSCLAEIYASSLVVSVLVSITWHRKVKSFSSPTSGISPELLYHTKGKNLDMLFPVH